MHRWPPDSSPGSARGPFDPSPASPYANFACPSSTILRYSLVEEPFRHYVCTTSALMAVGL